MNQYIALTNVETEPNRNNPHEDVITFTVVAIVDGYAYWEIAGWKLIGGKIQVPKKLQKVQKGTLQTNVVFPHYGALRTIYEAIRASNWPERYKIGQLIEPARRLAEPYTPPPGTPTAPLYVPDV